MAEKNRIIWIDQLRGLAFYTVILGHMSILYGLKSLIYSFHMPLFFMITGLVFNLEKIYNTKFKNFCLRLVEKMLIPYFCLQILSIPIRCLVCVIAKRPINIAKWILGVFVANNNIVEAPSNPLYYVLLLMLAQIGLWVVIKIAKANKTYIAIILGALSIISVCFQRINLPWHINVVPVAMLLIFIGVLLMDLYVLTKDKLEKLNKWCYFGICILLFAIGVLFNRLNGRISIHGNYYGNSFLLFLACAVVFSVAIALVVMLLPESKILTFIGANTLFYMGIHKPVLLLFEAIVGNQNKSNPIFIIVGSVVCVLALAPLAWIVNKYLPFVCGNKSKPKP